MHSYMYNLEYIHICALVQPFFAGWAPVQPQAARSEVKELGSGKAESLQNRACAPKKQILSGKLT